MISHARFLKPEPAGFACARCGARVASERDYVAILERPIEAAYVNPAGVECRIVTLRAARNLAFADVATAEHTWFEKYSWRPALCAKCGSHLGWRYEACEAGLEPCEFYGLLVGSLVKVPDAGRDM